MRASSPNSPMYAVDRHKGWNNSGGWVAPLGKKQIGYVSGRGLSYLVHCYAFN